MLDDLAVLQPEEVADRIGWRARCGREARVQRDEVALRDDPEHLPFRVWHLFDQPFEILRGRLAGALRHVRLMFDEAGSDISLECRPRLLLDQRLAVEGLDDLAMRPGGARSGWRGSGAYRQQCGQHWHTPLWGGCWQCKPPRASFAVLQRLACVPSGRMFKQASLSACRLSRSAAPPLSPARVEL